MEGKKFFTGIDIGTTRVRVAVGKPIRNGMWKLLATGESFVEGAVVRSSITNINKTVRAMNEAVAEAAKKLDVTIDVVNVNVSGRHLHTLIHSGSIRRYSSKGEVSVEDVNRLNQDVYRMATSAEDNVIHIIPKEYSVDHEKGIKDPIGMSGVHVEGVFHVVTTQGNIIKNAHKCANKAGLTIDKLLFSPLAASLSVLTEEEKDAGVCLVDIGASMMGVTIYHGGALQHIVLIPFASKAVTKDLAQAFMLTESQAETLKVQFGSAYAIEDKNEVVVLPGLRNRPEKEVFLPVVERIIEARMEEAIQFVYKEIISAGFQDKLPGGIVITGGGANLSGLDKLFHYITGYDTRIGYPNEFLQSDEGATLPGPEYATAIGLFLASSKTLGSSIKNYGNKEQNHRGKKGKKKKEARKKKTGFLAFLRRLFR